MLVNVGVWMRTVAVRLPDGVIKIIDELCSDLGESRAKVLREILMEGIRVLRLRKALKMLSEGKITVWRAAEIAGLSLWEFIEVIEKEKVVLPISVKDVVKDLLEGL